MANKTATIAIQESIFANRYNGENPQEFLENILKEVSDWVKTSNESEGGIEEEYLVAESLLFDYFPNSEFLPKSEEEEYDNWGKDCEYGQCSGCSGCNQDNDFDPNFEPIDEWFDEWFDDSDIH